MGKVKWLVLMVLLVALLAGLSLILRQSGTDEGTEAGKAPTYHRPVVFEKYRPIAVLGEAHRPTLFERWIHFKEDNTEAQNQLFDLLKRENPALLVFLGNQVNRGSVLTEWHAFDLQAQYFLKNKIPVLSILGDRNYAGGRSLEHAKDRFPDLRERTWYMLIYLNLGFVFLDSNYVHLGEELWIEQQVWFSRVLRQFDGHKAVDGVIVFVHHPPMTNGAGGAPSEKVRETFLEPFNSARKTLLMIAGHVGAFEKFYEQDKYILVTGGAGAPRAELARGEERPYNDLFSGAAPRPFHYLLLMSVQGGITFEVKGFDKGETNIRQIEKSFVPFR